MSSRPRRLPLAAFTLLSSALLLHSAVADGEVWRSSYGTFSNIVITSDNETRTAEDPCSRGLDPDFPEESLSWMQNAPSYCADPDRGLMAPNFADAVQAVDAGAVGAGGGILSNVNTTRGRCAEFPSECLGPSGVPLSANDKVVLQMGVTERYAQAKLTWDTPFSALGQDAYAQPEPEAGAGAEAGGRQTMSDFLNAEATSLSETSAALTNDKTTFLVEVTDPSNTYLHDALAPYGPEFVPPSSYIIRATPSEAVALRNWGSPYIGVSTVVPLPPRYKVTLPSCDSGMYDCSRFTLDLHSSMSLAATLAFAKRLRDDVLGKKGHVVKVTVEGVHSLTLAKVKKALFSGGASPLVKDKVACLSGWRGDVCVSVSVSVCVFV